jgi:hypothetical protein
MTGYFEFETVLQQPGHYGGGGLLFGFEKGHNLVASPVLAIRVR